MYPKDIKDMKKILDEHKLWLNGKSEGKRADLAGANLSGANLSGANLSGANLSRAILSGANLSRAILSGANLSGAILSGANLSGANLSGADLYGANLSEADLYGADLYGAILSEADLCGADLSGANLSGADLYGANLSRAKITFINFPINTIKSLYLGNLNNELTIELMIRDCISLPKMYKERFVAWARGGECPMLNAERAWNFQENRYLLLKHIGDNKDPWVTQYSDSDLIIEICKCKGWGIKGVL